MKTLTRLLQMKILLAHKMRNTGWLLDFFFKSAFFRIPFFSNPYHFRTHFNAYIRTENMRIGQLKGQ